MPQPIYMPQDQSGLNNPMIGQMGMQMLMQMAMGKMQQNAKQKQLDAALKVETAKRESIIATRPEDTDIPSGYMRNHNKLTQQWEVVPDPQAKLYENAGGDLQHFRPGVEIPKGWEPHKSRESMSDPYFMDIGGKPTKVQRNLKTNKISTIKGGGGVNINLGQKRLTPGQANVLSEGKQLRFVLDPLKSTIDQNKKMFGPIRGRAGQINPYDVKAQTIDANMRRASQVIGKFMEGGVLRKEDEEKYRKMLPQLQDTPEVAKKKLEGVDILLRKKYNQFLSDYGNAGYDVSRFSTIPEVDEVKNNRPPLSSFFTP